MVDKKESKKIKIKRLNELQEDFKEMYEEDPRDWQVSLSRNIHDPNLLVTNRRGIWQIKLDSYFRPKPIGLGTQIGDADDATAIIKRRTGPSYGFRSLNMNQIEKFHEKLMQDEPIDNLIKNILATDPEPIKRISSPLSLQGPVMLSKNIQYVSEKQKLLDRKLKKELLKLS
ncbi:MAG: hypothetical protein ACTSVY_07130, partial [Candidatus Helarchaeota archaeon]